MSEWKFGVFEVSSVIDSYHVVFDEHDERQRVRRRTAYAQLMKESLRHKVREITREDIQVNPDSTAETKTYKVTALAFELDPDDHLSPGNKIELTATRVCD